jgi:NitT/TauT family transport system ATP-binding protein
MSAGPVLEVLSAGKMFPNGTRALAPVDLTVRGRELVTLIGPSGCGKSTLLRMAAGLIEPSEGRLRWWGEGLQPLGRAGRKLFLVFQNPTLMPWARLRANVRLPLDLARVERTEAERRVDEALARVRLSSFERHFPRELSGGMQMRASIARALVTEPDLLLMDEPFGALDEISRNALDAELLGLCAERPLTVLFVTHSIYEAVFLSTRVLVMGERPGRILNELTIDEPLPRPDGFRVSQAFAGYCRQLSANLADASRPAHTA